MAGSKKPDALLVAEEGDWKRYGFPDILKDEVEKENAELRKKLAGFEARMADRERILDAVKSELEMSTQHISTLKTANDSAINWAKSREAELDLHKKYMRRLYGRYDHLRSRSGANRPNFNDRITEIKDPDPEIGITKF
jgi:hypothetical protein